MFPNASLGTHRKGTNPVKSAFVAFLVEHCLCSFLCNFVKSHLYQRFKSIWITAASSYLMNKIMYTNNSFKHDKKSSLDVIKDDEYQINPLKLIKLIDILIDYSK